jgi:hypothetical protein
MKEKTMNVQIRNASDVSAAKTGDLLAFYNSHMAADKKISKFTNRAIAEKRVNKLLEEIKTEESNWVAPVEEAVEVAVQKGMEQAEKRIQKELERAEVTIKEKVTEVVKRQAAAPTTRVIETGEVKAPVEVLEHVANQATKPARKPGTQLTLAKGKKPETTPAKPGYKVEHLEKGDRIVPVQRKSNAEGIAASWADPTVRAERLNRQAVVVITKNGAHQHNSTKAAFEALGLPLSKHIRFRMKLKEAGKLDFEHEGKTFTFTIA